MLRLRYGCNSQIRKNRFAFGGSRSCPCHTTQPIGCLHEPFTHARSDLGIVENWPHILRPSTCCCCVLAPLRLWLLRATRRERDHTVLRQVHRVSSVYCFAASSSLASDPTTNLCYRQLNQSAALQQASRQKPEPPHSRFHQHAPGAIDYTVNNIHRSAGMCNADGRADRAKASHGSRPRVGQGEGPRPAGARRCARATVWIESQAARPDRACAPVCADPQPHANHAAPDHASSAPPCHTLLSGPDCVNCDGIGPYSCWHHALSCLNLQTTTSPPMR